MTNVTTEPEHDDTELSVEDMDTGPDDTTSDDTGGPAATPPRSSAWIAWTLAVALAAVAAVAIVQWRSVAGPAAAVDEARDAAVAYVTTLSTWDASDGLEPTYAALVAGATEEFVPEVDEVFGNEQREQLVASDAVSTGTIEDVLTGDLEDTGVPIVVVVEQFIVTGPSADPVARTERVALLQMVEEGGTWKVADLEMLSELQLSEEDQ